jgi:hypothetical protein
MPEVLQPEPVGDLPPERPAPPTNKPRPSGPRETAKPDPKPAEPAVEPAVQAVQPPPTLRTPATADTAAVERVIREILQRAQGNLKSIDYQKQPQAGKDVYNDAKGHIEGAEAAIKASNFELAKSLAEKAEKLARGLQGK